MTILLDADILLDIAFDRKPHAAAAAELVDRIERGQATGFIAWHTLSNVYYLLRPKDGATAARAFLSDLLAFVGVAPVSTANAKFAASLPMADFEDALQAAAAIACRADAIATRNIRHYSRSPVRAETPAKLLRNLA